MKISALTAVMFFLFAAPFFAFDAGKPADRVPGYWKSVSDVKGEEGKITAYWKLSVDDSGVLEGEIVHCPGTSEDKVYSCDNKEFDGKKYVNTVWIRNMKKTSPGCWSGGTIVDVRDKQGNVYGCEMKLSGDGNILETRGFVGMSLFGRTQLWQRSSEDEVEAAREKDKDKSSN
ncbi:MAG: DUF2147 domain-containing protein [Brevinematales bacterium]|jgi:uncharacterized protein (DUF2147 family)